jgi:hypothetical protein
MDDTTSKHADRGKRKRQGSSKGSRSVARPHDREMTSHQTAAASECALKKLLPFANRLLAGKKTYSRHIRHPTLLYFSFFLTDNASSQGGGGEGLQPQQQGSSALTATALLQALWMNNQQQQEQQQYGPAGGQYSTNNNNGPPPSHHHPAPHMDIRPDQIQDLLNLLNTQGVAVANSNQHQGASLLTRPADATSNNSLAVPTTSRAGVSMSEPDQSKATGTTTTTIPGNSSSNNGDSRAAAPLLNYEIATLLASLHNPQGTGGGTAASLPLNDSSTSPSLSQKQLLQGLFQQQLPTGASRNPILPQPQHNESPLSSQEEVVQSCCRI